MSETRDVDMFDVCSKTPVIDVNRQYVNSPQLRKGRHGGYAFANFIYTKSYKTYCSRTAMHVYLRAVEARARRVSMNYSLM